MGAIVTGRYGKRYGALPPATLARCAKATPLDATDCRSSTPLAEDTSLMRARVKSAEGQGVIPIARV
jgi:hypothetical protein